MRPIMTRTAAAWRIEHQPVDMLGHAGRKCDAAAAKALGQYAAPVVIPPDAGRGEQRSNAQRANEMRCGRTWNPALDLLGSSSACRVDTPPVVVARGRGCESGTSRGSGISASRTRRRMVRSRWAMPQVHGRRHRSGRCGYPPRSPIRIGKIRMAMRRNQERFSPAANQLGPASGAANVFIAVEAGRTEPSSARGLLSGMRSRRSRVVHEKQIRTTHAVRRASLGY